MKCRDLHPWNVTPVDARKVQEELASQVILADRLVLDDIRLVAGMDNSYVKEGAVTTAYAAVVVLTFPELEVFETAVASRPVDFPYVPGLLSFREAPAIITACERIATEPDVVLFDGQGYAHPRRLGLASHLGLILDLPAIGCAKSRLIGRYESRNGSLAHFPRLPMVTRSLAPRCAHDHVAHPSSCHRATRSASKRQSR